MWLDLLDNIFVLEGSNGERSLQLLQQPPEPAVLTAASNTPIPIE
jgi:hypothetical protein